MSGGFAAGLRYATGIGAEAIQVFVSNPRSWSLPAGDAAARDRAADEIRDQLAGAGLPVFVHTPYLINVGSADPVIRERSVASVRHSLDRGRAIGARGVVVHTGSAAGGDRDKSMLYARECLLPVLDSIPADGPDLLLEPMAGAGPAALHHAWRSWGPTWRCSAGTRAPGCAWTPATCSRPEPTSRPPAARPRSWASSPGCWAAGPARLGLVHANDSKDPCGSRRDRHQNIGAGQIGVPPFGVLLRHPAAAGVPFVIETPGPRAAHAADIATLRGLRDG